MTVRCLLLVFVLLGLLNACGTKHLVPAEYRAWVTNKSNGLVSEKTINEYVFTVQYLPSEFLALKDLSGSMTKTSIAESLKNYEGYHYIKLRISKEDKKGDILKGGYRNAYYEKLQHLMTGIQNDFSMLDGQDTLPCSFSHFERTYGLSPHIDIIAAFEKPAHSNQQGYNDLTFRYEDILFENGLVHINLKAKYLNSLPQLVLN